MEYRAHCSFFFLSDPTVDFYTDVKLKILLCVLYTGDAQTYCLIIIISAPEHRVFTVFILKVQKKYFFLINCAIKKLFGQMNASQRQTFTTCFFFFFYIV